MEPKIVYHELPSIFDENSRVLLLGSMPSPKSREVGFYYGHPQNRFWKVLSAVYNTDCLSMSSVEKTEFLHKNHIALWDVIYSCFIHGASDASIKNAVPNDISALIQRSKVKTIFTIGTKASTLYKKLCYPQTNIPDIQLPSTSPANCRVPFDVLVEKYGMIRIAAKTER